MVVITVKIDENDNKRNLVAKAMEDLDGGKGHTFTTHFYKRSDGSERTMPSRLNVKSRLKGGVRGYTDKAKDTITVFDMGTKTTRNYKAIPVEGVDWVGNKEVRYEFVG